MRRIRSAIAAFLLAWLPACYSYRVTTVAPEQAIEGQKVVVVRVPQNAGTREVKLQSPWVRNDSIGGLECTMTPIADGRLRETCERDWSAPLADVRAITTRQVNTGRTVVAAVALAGGVVVAAALVMAASWTHYCSNHPNDFSC